MRLSPLSRCTLLLVAWGVYSFGSSAVVEASPTQSATQQPSSSSSRQRYPYVPAPGSSSYEQQSAVQPREGRSSRPYESPVIAELENTINVLAQAFDLMYSDTLNLLEGTSMRIVEDNRGAKVYAIEIPLENVKKDDVDVYLDAEGNKTVVRIYAPAAPEDAASQGGGRGEPLPSRNPPPPGVDDLSGANWVVRPGDREYWQGVIDQKREQRARERVSPGSRESGAGSRESGGIERSPARPERRRERSPRRPRQAAPDSSNEFEDGHRHHHARHFRGEGDDAPASAPGQRRGRTIRAPPPPPPPPPPSDSSRPQPTRRQHHVAGAH